MKKACVNMAGIAVLLVAVVPVRADSITPSSFSATIAPGGSTTVNKTVTVTQQLTTPLDLFFLVDTTGSMGSAISSVASGFSSIVSTISGVAPNVAFGLGEYKDTFDSFTYRLDADITTNTSTVQSALGSLSAGGGGDLPEAGLYGLQQAATTTSWRSGSQRFLVWVGDAPSHDPAGPTNVTEAQAISALNANGVNVFAASATSGPGLNAACGGSDCTANQAKRVAAGTSGSDLGTFDSAAISTAIQNAITSIVNNYSSVSLDSVGLPAGVTVSFSPAITGSFDRSITRTFNFTATITGVTPGTYDFGIAGLVDGRPVATETDHIVVGGAVPEPSTWLFAVSGVASLLVMLRRRKA